MDKVLESALKRGAKYTDVRFSKILTEDVVVKNSQVITTQRKDTQGYGIRVWLNGKWGFISRGSIDNDHAKLALNAVKKAKTSPEPKKQGIVFFKATKDAVRNTYRIDPFERDWEDKIEFLMSLNGLLEKTGEPIDFAGHFKAVKVYTHVLSSTGIDVEIESIGVGLIISLVTKCFGVPRETLGGLSRWAGLEAFEDVNLDDFMLRTKNLAAKSSSSRSLRRGKYDLILSPTLAGLLIHETIGHASEGDNYIEGKSSLKGKLGQMISSSQLSLFDDDVPGGVFAPYDDEGTPKTKTYIIRKGMLVGLLTSLSEVAELGLPPSGNGRAQDYTRFPICRQTNICIEPGNVKVQEMIDNIKSGLYLSSVGGDAKIERDILTMSGCMGQIIEKGELRRSFKGVCIQDSVMNILNGINTIGTDPKVYVNIFGKCYKRRQRIYVGRSAPHLQISNVAIV